MTTPTQAQVEAAKREYNERIENNASQDAAMFCALTAAAEVNEPSKMFAYISGQTTGKIAELEAREEYALGHLGSQIEQNEKLRAELAATIERCAQVADKYSEATEWAVPIGAAIRTLKGQAISDQDDDLNSVLPNRKGRFPALRWKSGP